MKPAIQNVSILFAFCSLVPQSFGAVLIEAQPKGKILSRAAQHGDAPFSSTVQFAIREDNPVRFVRARDLLIREFTDRIQHSVKDHPQSLRTIRTLRSGNEVVFTVTSQEDLQDGVQASIKSLIQFLNQNRVRVQGRSRVYRANLNHQPAAQFQLTVHNPQTKTLSIRASRAPLIDILQEIRRQIRDFSYIIPEECAHRKVYWAFGELDPGNEPQRQDLTAAMNSIAKLLQVRAVASGNSFEFAGRCDGMDVVEQPAPIVDGPLPTPREEWLGLPRRQGRPPQAGELHAIQVDYPVIPLVPIGY